MTWSRALAEEVKPEGVTVYMVLPAFVVGPATPACLM